MASHRAKDTHHLVVGRSLHRELREVAERERRTIRTVTEEALKEGLRKRQRKT